MTVEYFTFSPFYENTYLLHDETKKCIIVDPGCYSSEERNQLKTVIEERGLNPVKLLHTHCHIDHVFGNQWVCEEYGLSPHFHQEELQILKAAPMSAQIYGVNYSPSPENATFLKEGEQITFGNTTLDIIFVPGHSPGHLAFIHHPTKTVINGDVLFRESIGRTDLPLGDHPTLIRSIQEKLFTLPDDYTVYSGHTKPTTIGHEKKFNPFLRGK